jgi:hypothetical protein
VPALAIRLYHDPEAVGLHLPRLLSVCHIPIREAALEKSLERPLPLKNAPLQYAPESELGEVFMFSRIARKLQFRIEKTRAAYPDCIAYRHVGESEKRVRIEFEFRSSSFRSHGHDAKQCDCIVCWHHDWPGVPRHLEVIELKRFFGTPFKVWIQAAIKTQWDYLDSHLPPS